MFGLGSIQTYISIGLTVTILGLASAIYILDGKLEDKTDALLQARANTATAIANIEIVKAANAVTLASFKDTLEQIEFYRDSEINLNVRLRQLETYTAELQDKLARHDLEALALAKPGLVENIINNGTGAVFQKLEDITGDNL